MTSATKNYISVYAEATPNPDALKFVVNRRLVGDFSFDFRTMEEAQESPLASELFNYDFVDGVFVMNNFVSITKKGDQKWVELIPVVREFLKAWFEEGKPIVTEKIINQVTREAEEIQQSSTGEDIESKIIQILDQSVKPAVEMDGGAIHFKSFSNGVVTVVLKGSCSGCPSSTITLRNGIEGLLKRMIPEVEEVIAEEG